MQGESFAARATYGLALHATPQNYPPSGVEADQAAGVLAKIDSSTAMFMTGPLDSNRPCRCRKSNPNVLMMQSTDDRVGLNASS